MHIIDENRNWVILLVEDDPADQELTRRALGHVTSRCILEVVEDGEEALDYLFQRGRHAQAKRPDLVLLDLNLPKLDGRQVLQHLRSQVGLRDLPVVALTTSRQTEDIEQAYRLGANSFICKPATLDGYRSVMESIQDYWFRTVLLPSRV